MGVQLDVMRQFLRLVGTVGTGGSHVPVLSAESGKKPMPTRPVIFTEKVPALGTKGDVMLLDLTSYVVGIRADFTLAKSMHAGFATDTTFSISRSDSRRWPAEVERADHAECWEHVEPVCCP